MSTVGKALANLLCVGRWRANIEGAADEQCRHATLSRCAKCGTCVGITPRIANVGKKKTHHVAEQGQLSLTRYLLAPVGRHTRSAIHHISHRRTNASTPAEIEPSF